ncbi:SUMF1/EgtB/PvdO family nonheme iron enzyme [Aquincola sp. S2]|uniref:SUMF1/EgtB/PvdO family nonheme iron enzyme n=1 Tax=Pseudaquabacterium terrae TaxID=2732868 RepID=A0ABX2EEP4_9BURK|nr:SUMF1/EgtB/PvdO family nonheme iron enzyme [Aquabacterium terrae]NRF67071.1 SUMF1/EgtB/PvdO family nonheme iron enzyme [Aquabacterium terrae]
MSFGNSRSWVGSWAQAAVMLAGGLSSAWAQAPWPATQFNPVAAADDVVLPMPCGGSMAFRRVNVPSADPLDDRRVQLGNAEARFGYAEATRTDYVAGGFADPKAKNQRYYLIGKYEVTQAQYDALSGTCKAPTEDHRLPKTSLTWTEAVFFSGRYADWLAKNAAAKMPSDEGTPGFVRLPTEGEWEFAARGGIAVQETVFEQTAFPMAEGMQRYVWYAGTESSNNELNVIGLLKPNPLGLHDMLGNAGEFVLDPFRLNKHSRLHGQAGGYTVKGGDYRTPAADIRAAARIESPPVDKNGERREKTTGFRLVVVPASLPTPARLNAVRTLWGNLAQSPPGGGTGAAAQALADPVKEVEALAKAVNDPALKSRIEGVGGVIKANIQARNEQRDRSAKSEVRVGAYLARKVIEDRGKIKSLESTIAGPMPEDMKAPFRSNLAASKDALDANLNYLIDTLKQVGLDFPTASISAQGEILKREFEARKVPGYGPLVDLVVRYSLGVRTGKPIDKTALANDLGKL